MDTETVSTRKDVITGGDFLPSIVAGGVIVLALFGLASLFKKSKVESEEDRAFRMFMNELHNDPYYRGDYR